MELETRLWLELGLAVGVLSFIILILFREARRSPPRKKNRKRNDWISYQIDYQEVEIPNELPRKSGNLYTADELRLYLDPDTPVSINKQQVGTVGKLFNGG